MNVNVHAAGLGFAPLAEFFHRKMFEVVLPSLFGPPGASIEDLARWADDGGPVVGEEGPVLFDPRDEAEDDDPWY